MQKESKEYNNDTFFMHQIDNYQKKVDELNITHSLSEILYFH
jgi:hypothetical protein